MHRLQQTTQAYCITQSFLSTYIKKEKQICILMPETCWVYKKENKIASDIKLVYSSAITMMHGPINIHIVYNLKSYIIQGNCQSLTKKIWLHCFCFFFVPLFLVLHVVTNTFLSNPSSFICLEWPHDLSILYSRIQCHWWSNIHFFQ
jgi:hypothetical protein